jgi:nitronate monooxygenase
MKSRLPSLLGIEFPLIMAPMFLVSNRDMLLAGIRSGVMSVFPSLNYRDNQNLLDLLKDLNNNRQGQNGSYGVNLIVQRTNPYYKKHLEICIQQQVPFYITSLGNPKEVIAAARSYGAKVFCDVTNLEHAKKCADEGCDGFIAVGQGAGGHAGPNPLQVLIPALKQQHPTMPVVAAGGIVSGQGLLSVMVLGADGASVGTRFIASTESKVNDAYKNAIINSGMDDIVMTTRLSGTPCTIIDTPEAKKMGYSQTWFERFMSNNPNTKRWFKTFVQVRGMKRLQDSVLPNNYSRLWCAGKASELIHEVISCEEIISRIKKEFDLALQDLKHP